MAHLLSLVMAAPAVGALIVAVLPGARAGLVRLVTCAAAALALVLALPVWFTFQPRGAQWQFVQQADPAGWPYLVGVDGFAVALVLLTSIIGVVAAVLLTRESSAQPRAWAVALLLMETGVLGALVSLELRQMFVCWQLALLALAAMPMLSGARRTAVVGIALTVVGAAAMFSGLLALGEQYQSLASVASFDVRAFQTMPVRRPVQMQAFVLIALACLTPFVLLALYAWSVGTSPVGRAGGGPAAGLVASTLLGVLAIFGLVRVILPVMPQATRTFATAMMIAGGVLAALAVLAAAMSRARVAVSWIGLAQALLAIVGVFAATPNALTGAAVQLVAALLAVAALVPIVALFRLEPDTAIVRLKPDTTYVASGFSRTDAVIMVVAVAAIAAGFTGGRLLASGLAPFGQAAGYMTLLVSGASALVLLSIGVRRPVASPPAGVVELAFTVPSIALLLALAFHPAPLLARLETSVARVVVRVSPEYASQVADCLNQPAPPPADSGLPAGMMLAAPCTDASSTADPAVKR
jgi:NADH-quinone oxidoreductase subunit M